MARRTPRLPWLRRQAGRYILPSWFGIFALVHVFDLAWGSRIGIDARIYHRGASYWLDGLDPWSAAVTLSNGQPYHFAGLPPTVLVFAPTTPIPEEIFGPAFVVMSAFAALWIIRQLQLPWWWLAFPPLVQGILLGNPGVAVLALLLAAHPAARGLAAAVKVYAVVPMVFSRDFTGLFAFTAAAAASMVLFQDLWANYFTVGPSVAGRLLDQTAGGAGGTAYPWLLAITGVAFLVVVVLEPRSAGWLAVPALWPSAQYHYPVMAMPVISGIVAAVMAPPVVGLPAMGVVLHAWLILRTRTAHQGTPRAGDRSEQGELVHPLGSSEPQLREASESRRK